MIGPGRDWRALPAGAFVVVVVGLLAVTLRSIAPQEFLAMIGALACVVAGFIVAAQFLGRWIVPEFVFQWLINRLAMRVPGPFVLVDPAEMVVLVFNPRAISLFDISGSAAHPYHILDFCDPVQPDGQPAPERARSTVVRTLAGEIVKSEWRLHTAAGRPLLLEMHSARLRLVGRVIIAVSFSDITSRDAMLQQLRAQHDLLIHTSGERDAVLQALDFEHRRMHTLVNTLPDLIYVKDLESRFVLGNQALADWMEVSPEELIGKADADFFVPAMAADFRDEESQIFETGIPVLEQERSGLYANGDPYCFVITKIPLRDGDGNIIGLVGVAHDITERRMMEDQVSQSEAEYRALFRAMSDVILIMARDGRYVRVLPTRDARYYLEPDELVGRTVHEVFPLQTANIFVEAIQRALAEPGNVRLEYKLEMDGGEVWFDATVTSLDEETVMWVARDVTARHQMEAVLRENEQLYRSLIEQSNDPIFLIRDEQFMLVNSAFEETFSLSLPELQMDSRSWFSGLETADRQLVEAQVFLPAGTLPAVERIRFELTAVNAAGDLTQFEASVSYHVDQDEVAVQGILRDVTVYKRAQATLQQANVDLERRVLERTAEIQEQHQRTIAILDAVADAVVVVDQSGAVTMANPVAQALLDVPAETANPVAGLVQHLADQDQPVITEEVELDDITYQAKAARLAAHNQRDDTVIVLRDITRLRELDRLKTQFVHTVSHELRTPLANIKLYLSLLQRGKRERIPNYMAVLDREVKRLERLIGDLLDIARLERGVVNQHEMVVMDDVIGQVIENLMPQVAERQLSLQYDVAEDLPPLWAARDQMIQVMTNLLGNAIMYTPEGGTITVRAFVTAEEDAAPGLVIEVADTGPGISERDLPRIFDRFFRGELTEHQSSGTGLGLSITKEIVEQHCGKIEVNSHLHQGSVFRVSLPLNTEDQ